MEHILEFNEFINELRKIGRGDFYPFELGEETWDEIDDGILVVEYNFKTKSGKTYDANFYSGEYSSDDKTFEFSFGVKKEPNRKLDALELTGEGEGLKILRTMVKIIEEFLEDYEDEADKIIVKGSTPKRLRIYQTYLKEYLPPKYMKKIEFKK